MLIKLSSFDQVRFVGKLNDSFILFSLGSSEVARLPSSEYQYNGISNAIAHSSHRLEWLDTDAFLPPRLKKEFDVRIAGKTFDKIRSFLNDIIGTGEYDYDIKRIFPQNAKDILSEIVKNNQIDGTEPKK